MGMVSRILLLGALFFAGTTHLFAQKKELIVGVENINYYPYYDFSGREYSGFFKEVMELFGKEKGYTVVFKPLPVKRLYTELLESGQIDLKFPDNPHWGGEYKKGKTVHYSDGVVMFIDGTLVQPEHAGEGIGNFHRLGTIAGFTPWTYMAHIDKGAVVNVETRSMTSLLMTLLAGRIDGAYVNIAAARYVLDEVLHQKGALVWNEKLPFDKNFYHISTVRYPGIVAEFNRFLKEEAVRIGKLREKYRIKVDE